ncbi:hypothetical protein [Candidatus Bartonella washoeensis]|uniref:hypothetical protein n=1 Tax=Candidatus Bartonella washoeensis TaxID=186739 RepID=UPI003B215E38
MISFLQWSIRYWQFPRASCKFNLTKSIKAVITPEFGRIFYRNAWNLGLIAIKLQNASFERRRECKHQSYRRKDRRCKRTVPIQPPSKFMVNILDKGWLLNYVCQQL